MLQVVSATSGALASPKVHCFFHNATNTCSYIVECTRTKKAAILDSVLDYATNSGKLSTEYADEIMKTVEKENLSIEWILDTHVHADHITGMAYLRKKYPSAKTAISERIKEVQTLWAQKFEFDDFDCSGSQWDFLLCDPVVPSSSESVGERILKELKIGELVLKPLPTPGHTPACMCFLVGDTLFSGDAIFQPDYGTARCDFPGGSSAQLYESISHTLYSLPDDTRVFVGHDYPPASRQVAFLTDIASEKSSNKYLTASTSKETFVTARDARDAELDAPRLLFPSLQFNINAGAPRSPTSKGNRFVKIPLRIAPGLDF